MFHIVCTKRTINIKIEFFRFFIIHIINLHNEGVHCDPIKNGYLGWTLTEYNLFLLTKKVLRTEKTETIFLNTKLNEFSSNS